MALLTVLAMMARSNQRLPCHPDRFALAMTLCLRSYKRSLELSLKIISRLKMNFVDLWTELIDTIFVIIIGF